MARTSKAAKTKQGCKTKQAPKTKQGPKRKGVQDDATLFAKLEAEKASKRPAADVTRHARDFENKLRDFLQNGFLRSKKRLDPKQLCVHPVAVRPRFKDDVRTSLHATSWE